MSSWRSWRATSRPGETRRARARRSRGSRPWTPKNPTPLRKRRPGPSPASSYSSIPGATPAGRIVGPASAGSPRSRRGSDDPDRRADALVAQDGHAGRGCGREAADRHRDLESHRRSADAGVGPADQRRSTDGNDAPRGRPDPRVRTDHRRGVFGRPVKPLDGLEIDAPLPDTVDIELAPDLASSAISTPRRKSRTSHPPSWT